MKKYVIAVIMSFVMLFSVMSVSVFADDVTVINWDDEEPAEADVVQGADSAAEMQQAKPFLALGADLTPEQLAAVINLMGLDGQDLSQYDIIYVTNAMEHQYLDKYVDSKVIGTRALSSVLVRQAEPGHGVVVTTKNINFCTVDMYRNALLTAGVKDADIMVVGPTSISGTAALIGAIKAYEQMSGQAISETILDTAVDELVVTGDLANALGNSDEITELIAFIKAQIAGKKLDTKEDIEKAVRDAVSEYGASLSESDIQQIINLMVKIKDLGLDYDSLISQAEDLYNKIDLDDLGKLASDSGVMDSIGGFFTGILDAIVNFFTGLFGN